MKTLKYLNQFLNKTLDELFSQPSFTRAVERDAPGGENIIGESYASNAEAVSALGVGVLYKSTTLINGSPIILLTV